MLFSGIDARRIVFTLLALVISYSLTPVESAHAQTNFTWNAPSDSDLAGYRFYRGTSSSNINTPVSHPTIGTVTSYPIANLDLPDGTHWIALRAYDTSSNLSGNSNAVQVTIAPPADTQNPTVSLAALSTVTSAQTINFSASANDNVAVARVEFSRTINGVTTAIRTDTTSPYTASWNVSAANNGTYTIRARAFDTSGNQASAFRTLTVNIPTPDTQNPIVTLSSPSSINTAQTINFSANADDNVAVARVEFYRNNLRFRTDSSSPYTASWAVTAADNGTYTIRARAIDTASPTPNFADSTRTLTINIPTPDTEDPTVSIQSPANGANFTSAQTVAIRALAGDNFAVTRVRFRNGSFEFNSFSEPHVYNWSIDEGDNGSHTWQVTAYDAAGNTASTSRTVTVDVVVDPDTDEDGTPDSEDTDDDNDSVLDVDDCAPLNADFYQNVNYWTDTDGDNWRDSEAAVFGPVCLGILPDITEFGFTFNAEADDNCPVDTNTDQLDSDGDGIGDVCDDTPLPPEPTPTPMPTPDPTPVSSSPIDFDGDGVSDVAFLGQADGQGYEIFMSDTGTTSSTFGSDKPSVPAHADYDGDGKTDLAYVENGASSLLWVIQSSVDGSTSSVEFGKKKSEILAGCDFDADGVADFFALKGKKAQALLSSTGEIKKLRAPVAKKGRNFYCADTNGDGADEVFFAGTAKVASEDERVLALRTRKDSLFGFDIDGEPMFSERFVPTGALLTSFDYGNDGSEDLAFYKAKTTRLKALVAGAKRAKKVKVPKIFGITQANLAGTDGALVAGLYIQSKKSSIHSYSFETAVATKLASAAKDQVLLKAVTAGKIQKRVKEVPAAE